MKLSIVIPAYNEEDAIDNIIERCVKAREHICTSTSLQDVEIIVVNDGSTDNTGQVVKKAARAGKVLMVSYKKNRGYGAAIKRGFKSASGEFLAFLDADGTCDPNYFSELFNNLERNNADISIGSRMGSNSEMPTIRRVGNFAFAWLINLVGHSRITDSASGMRILRRSCLSKLYPLPDGMHFTPSMSAKAIMDQRLKIVEIDMPYRERVGESKLNVLTDGWRFFKTIVESGLFYKPLRIFFAGFLVLLILCLGYGIPLTVFYLNNHKILDTDIYRIVTIITAGVLGLNLLLLGIVIDEVVSIFNERQRLEKRYKNPLIRFLLKPRIMILEGALLAIGGMILVILAAAEYFSRGTIHLHWVYVLTAAFLILLGCQLISYALVLKILQMHTVVLRFRKR